MMDRERQLRVLVQKFLRSRPMFYAFIRPQEACYFISNRKKLLEPILDFGCGDGFFLDVCRSGEPVDVGVDLAIDEPGTDRQRVYRSQLTYAGKALPLADHSVSTVVSNSVLEHVSDIECSIAEIFRVLKPGGYLLASVMTEQWDRHQLGRKILGCWYGRKLRQVQNHQNLLCESDWRALFGRHGFCLVSVHGYLPTRVAHLLEIFHYLSVSSLLWKKLFGRWVLIPGWHSRVGIDSWIASLLERHMETEPSDSSSLFFVLRKPLSGMNTNTPSTSQRS